MVGGVVASRPVIDKAGPRDLVVLADGAQCAFAAGVVAELEEQGCTWNRAWGAGLGAHVALLAVLGEAREIGRRWLQQGENGSPVLVSRLAAARARLGDANGVVVLPDALAMAGWLDPGALAEFFCCDALTCSGRLRRNGATCSVALFEARSGDRRWVALEECDGDVASRSMQAAASFLGGWPALEGEHGELLSGGAGVVAGGFLPPLATGVSCDVVCGFPVPGIPRPAVGRSLLEQVQRREELLAAATVQSWAEGSSPSRRLMAPGPDAWVEVMNPAADLGVEYPLPWERNSALTARLVELGRLVARSSASHVFSRRRV